MKQDNTKTVKWPMNDGGATAPTPNSARPATIIGSMCFIQVRVIVCSSSASSGTCAAATDCPLYPEGRAATSIGGGVYKSVDGGESWTFLGLEATERIHRIALHPTDPDVAYVAALGPLWGAGAERGLYKSEDGGETWRRVLEGYASTGCTDVQLVPGDPDTVFAALWQFRRRPWFFESGGPGSGLHRSDYTGISPIRTSSS